MPPPQEPCEIPYGIKLAAIVAMFILIVGIMVFK